MSWLRYQSQQSATPWLYHPVLMQLFGLSPMLGGTTTWQSALALAVVTPAVMLASTLAVALLRQYISEQWRFVAYLAVTSAFTCLFSVLLKLIAPAYVHAAGVYLPLVACNYLVLMELERSAYRQALSSALRSASYSGIAFALTLVIFSLLRLWFASGLDLLPVSWGSDDSRSLGELLHLPGVALLLLGLVIAAYQYASGRHSDTGVSESPSAHRARVTGQLR